MAACAGLGLAGVLPGDVSEDDVKDELRALARLDLCRRFYEVIGDRVYRFERDRVTEVTDPKRAAKMIRAWNANRGADLTYDQWGYLWGGAKVFLPGAKPPRGRLSLPRLGQHGYQAMGGFLYREPDMTDVADGVFHAWNAAYRDKFLFTISG